MAARHFLVLSDKETKQRKRFHHFKNQVSTACSFHSWVPEEHGARQNHRYVKPSFSVHRYPHASPLVTEPAQGTPRAIREEPSSGFVRTSNHYARPRAVANSDKERIQHITREDSESTNPAQTPTTNARTQLPGKPPTPTHLPNQFAIASKRANKKIAKAQNDYE